MQIRRRWVVAGVVLALTAALIPVSVLRLGTGQPVYRDAGQSVAARVADLLPRMSLADKIGQMTQAERKAVTGDPALVTGLRLGSVLSGGGSAPTPNTPQAWVDMINSFQAAALATPLKIPLLYGVDAVHGNGNVHGATIFPHNVGLGAGRDAALVEKVYRATAVEMRATGIPWNFAPCLCVSRDERWGRAFESFGEDPALVTRLGGAAVDGLERNGVVATVKHFAGDGGTVYGTGDHGYAIDQGVTVASRDDFARIALAPYVAAVREHGARSVMPSFSSVDLTEDGTGNPVKMHADQQLISGYLKGELGFGGFVVTDWEGVQQLPSTEPAGTPKPTASQVRTGVNAGIDMFMEPDTAPVFQANLTAEVQAGRVSMSRIDNAVRRILRVKFELGLFEKPYATVGPIGTDAHRELAREAVAKSQVLLKNDGVLPLRPDTKIYVAGRNADDIGSQAGGWTMDWQGANGDTIPGTTILDGIRSTAPDVTFSADAATPIGDAEVGVVVVGETPYAEWFGDVGGPVLTYGTAEQREPKLLTLQPSDKAVITKVCAAVPHCVVLIVSGRPQVITDQLASIDALVASWLPGSEGEGIADVLFGRTPFTGKLSMSWPRSVPQVPINTGDKTYQPLFPYGWGLHPGTPVSTRDAASSAVVAGAARPGWERLFADAEVAADTGDLARADSLYQQVSD
ncbi:glycoside hydrolase family 3 protein [Actinoplanes derwentensis]|uniref:beta-glucosidase n=1 Tax=Actinoplanes derwentensis TaxID=113562 RepID=A0A1H2ABH3_9ACTN|nr:glycoside hydrolase family 3 protein [Actinoplanes derwentensis]GID88933.1 beta-glucosidase [Actinoplanes derwentensis]SDT43237.1 beta-glucosidase [Actinoplanes derwentensis]